MVNESFTDEQSVGLLLHSIGATLSLLARRHISAIRVTRGEDDHRSTLYIDQRCNILLVRRHCYTIRDTKVVKEESAMAKTSVCYRLPPTLLVRNALRYYRGVTADVCHTGATLLYCIVATFTPGSWFYGRLFTLRNAPMASWQRATDTHVTMVDGYDITARLRNEPVYTTAAIRAMATGYHVIWRRFHVRVVAVVIVIRARVGTTHHYHTPYCCGHAMATRCDAIITRVVIRLFYGMRR